MIPEIIYRFQIGPDRWTVWLVDSIEDEDGKHLGKSNFTSKEILIARTDHDTMASTLLHELIHVVADSHDLGLDETAVLVLEHRLWEIGVRVGWF